MNLKALYLTLLLVLSACSAPSTLPTPPEPQPVPEETPTPDTPEETPTPGDPEPEPPTQPPEEEPPTQDPPEQPDTPPDETPPDVDRGELRVTFINVGQGDSVLIEAPTGQNVLYDGGRGQAALEYLQAQSVETIDLVIASHPDADHIGGLDDVINVYEPELYMDNGEIATTQTYERLLEAVEAAGSQLIEPTGQIISLGDVDLQIISPPGGGNNRNNNSVGVVIDFGEFETALTGDAEAEEFEFWQVNYSDLLQEVEVYKSAHHGSKNGDTQASVTTWSPETVVISVSATNQYGHPTPEALTLYDSVGATVYRTDQDGSVSVTASYDGEYSVTTTP